MDTNDSNINHEIIISHTKRDKSLDSAFQTMKEQIVLRGDLPHVSVATQLELLSGLNQFPLGKFIIEHGGVDAYWTDYLISEGIQSKPLNMPLHDLEEFMLYRSPTVLAHRERLKYTQEYIQKELKEQISLASIPCGAMKEFLNLNFKGISDFELTGIDLDQNALNLIHKQCRNDNLKTHLKLLRRDAWSINFKEQFDVISSHGLNVYVDSEDRIEQLYKIFHKSLKNSGKLLLTTLTPPPILSKNSPWNQVKSSDSDFMLDQILLYNVMMPKWQNFRSLSETCSMLEKIGFKINSVFDGSRGIVPLIIAQKKLY